MIRDDVLYWGVAILVVLLAFYLLPTYERLENAAPPAPPPAAPADNDEYILKSSLVPCTCPTYSASCPSHAGSMPSSKTPGDKDDDITKAKPDQSKISKPFSQAFPQETDPQPFLTSFAAFNR
jgi:hypothetical protein